MTLILDTRLRIGIQTIHRRTEPATGPWLPRIDELVDLVTRTARNSTRNLYQLLRAGHPADLCGASCLIRAWDRIGHHRGQLCSTPYPTPAEAQAALDKQRRAKERKGYA